MAFLNCSVKINTSNINNVAYFHIWTFCFFFYRSSLSLGFTMRPDLVVVKCRGSLRPV